MDEPPGLVIINGLDKGIKLPANAEPAAGDNDYRSLCCDKLVYSLLGGHAIVTKNE